MNLFHFQEEAPGSVFWHPEGWTTISNLNKLYEKKTKRSGIFRD